jgi:hypothetical protein
LTVIATSAPVPILTLFYFRINSEMDHQTKVMSAKPFVCETCDKYYKRKGSLKAHMRTKHTPRTEIIFREESIESLLQEEMNVLEDVGDLLDMDPVDELKRFADAINEEIDTVQVESSDLSEYAITATIEVIETMFDNELGESNDDLKNLRTTGQRDVESFLSTALPTIAPAVPACPEAASFFLQNPKQPIVDLTASHRSIVLPPLNVVEPISDYDETLDDSFEEVEAGELSALLIQFENLTRLKIKCDKCSEQFYTTEDVTNHKIKIHIGQNFTTLGYYTCEDCEIECIEREEFVDHMKTEHSEVADDDWFEMNILTMWVNPNFQIVEWSSLPETVQARREEAIRSKEAKAAVNVSPVIEELVRLESPISHQHKEASLPIMMDYLTSMMATMARQAEMLESLHVKTDWQSVLLVNLKSR